MAILDGFVVGPAQVVSPQQVLEVKVRREMRRETSDEGRRGEKRGKEGGNISLQLTALPASTGTCLQSSALNAFRFLSKNVIFQTEMSSYCERVFKGNAKVMKDF